MYTPLKISGRKLAPGAIFKLGREWLMVKTVGPVITRIRSDVGPWVRMSTEDRDGNASRVTVHADRGYEVREQFPKARGNRTRMAVKFSSTEESAEESLTE